MENKKKAIGIFIVAIIPIMGLLVLTTNAVAAPTTFFGEDLGLGESTRLSSHPNADAARDAFLAQISNPGVEDFESFSDGATAPLVVDFGATGTATLQSPSGSIDEIPSGTDGVGAYPISGDKFWKTYSDFYITFSEPQSAFGFYGVDIGDYTGQLNITYEDGTATTLTIPHTINCPGGTVIYFGFIDTEQEFINVSFESSYGGDQFAFDDFTIGTKEQIRPQAAPTLTPIGLVALVSLLSAIAAVAIVRKRR